MILASGSVPTGHSVQSVFQHRAVPLPFDGKPRDQRLGHVARPPAAELHGVLLSDYNIIRPGRASHEAREIGRSEEHTSELQSPCNLVCRLLLEKKKNNNK